MKTNLTYPVYMLLGDLAVMEYHPIHFMLVDEDGDQMQVKIDVPAEYIANAEEIIKSQISAEEFANPILSLEGLSWVYNQITEIMKPKKSDDEFEEDF